MTKKKIFLYSLITISILLLYIAFMVSDNNELSLKKADGELTLKETIVLGLNIAEKWDENARFYKLTSSDENKGGSRGETGKRYDWNLFFIVPGTDKHLLVGISKGEIDLEREIIGPKNEMPIDLDDIQLDSPKLLKIVRNKFDIYKGEEWATGYHFTLDNIDGKPVVTVVGIDKDKLFTKVDIDPKDGKIIGAVHKVPKGGELISISSKTNTPKILKTQMDIKGVSANGDNLVTWGDKKPSSYDLVNQPFIEFSNDNGETWTALNIHKSIEKSWFNSKNELYVATESELVRIKNTDVKMKSLLTLKTQLEKIDYSANDITILSNKNIYTTNDSGENWNKITEPEPVLFLQVSEDGNLIILTHERRILLNNGEKWIKIKLPTNEHELSDLKVIKNDLFLIMGNELWVYNLKNMRLNKLTTTMQISQLVKKGDKLFGISAEGNIYSINKGGGSREHITNRLFSIGDKIIADVETTQRGIFIATRPDFIWEEVK
ncbi:hypothetical protein QWT69_16515 [Sporosarcina oncorhynchi]|uniref:Exo-alpha-sialidase n=1 Tax=Sporosarcina oncorhynchi TaxID=3056444 RepID=A0ABZ0L799_9BACL|nr:hypothetical protein [Sporosarcina sp. T2O-4]WOV87431.1 hypothetical protein QWT69_16515 [Sporosarcina sp. T2O-4]